MPSNSTYPNPDQSILTTPYPRLKVIALYGLLGGSIGGFIMALLFLPDFSLQMLLIAIIFGTFFGFLPACLTGCWLAWRRRHIKTLGDCFAIFLTGFFMSLLVMTFFAYGAEQTTFSDFITNLDDNWQFLIMMGMVGGTSSLLIGSFALPKDQSNAQ